MSTIDEDILMETFDKWDNRDRRERFLKRMEHKFHIKEQRVSSDHY